MMPVREVSPGCFQWGDQKIYCGRGAKVKAIAQGRAILATGWKEAEYQPNQTLEDYDDEGLTHSSAIDGYQPFKYSVMTSRAETSLQDSRNAVAVLAPNDNGVAGVVHFTQEEDMVHIDYDITGLTDGEHGFHIHTYGDLTDGCDSACSHFNPDNTEHGGLDSKIRHLGDLGNIFSEKGVSKGRLSTDTLSLKSGKRNCIVGRMIIVHADRDDLGKGGDAESLKTGNAGKRVGCGVIGLAKSEVKCAETFEADSKEEKRLKKYVKTYGEEGAKVRNRIFKRILANAQDGTKAGQWSARKAQSLTEDYEKAMAKKNKRPYKSSKKTKSQKSLKDWGDQDWKTKSGKKSSKTGERYLPAKAIDALTDEEYKKTSAKKRKDMKKGKQFSDQPKTIAKKTAKFRNEEVVEWDDVEWNNKSPKKKKHEWQEDVEWDSESTKPSSVEISRSSNPQKKLMAVFYDSEGKKVKTTHFGQRGASDYTKHGDKERMERYLERHGGGTTTSTKEDWKDPTTAGSLSRWILWNKPDLEGSFKDYLKRFNLKGDLKVSKSAEEVTILAPIFGPTVLGFVAGAIIAHIANR